MAEVEKPILLPAAAEAGAPSVSAAAADEAAAGKNAQHDSLKWRIDVEDYVSENGDSVMGSVVESIMEASRPDKKDDVITVGLSGQAKFIGKHPTSQPADVPTATPESPPGEQPLLSERSRSFPSLPTGKPPVRSQPSPSPGPPEASAGVSAADVAAEKELEAAQSELSRLYSALKEARAVKAESAEEQEEKQKEVQKLQAALKDARTVVTKMEAGRPKKKVTAQMRPHGAAGGSGMAVPTAAAAATAADAAGGGFPMRRSISERSAGAMGGGAASPVHPQIMQQQGGGASPLPGYMSPNRFMVGPGGGSGMNATTPSPLGRQQQGLVVGQNGPMSDPVKKSVSFEMAQRQQQQQQQQQQLPVAPRLGSYGQMLPQRPGSSSGLVTGESLSAYTPPPSGPAGQNWQGAASPYNTPGFQAGQLGGAGGASPGQVFTPLMSDIPENAAAEYGANVPPDPAEMSPHAHWKAGIANGGRGGIAQSGGGDREDAASVASQNGNPLQSVVSSEAGDSASTANGGLPPGMSPWRTASPYYNFYRPGPGKPRSVTSSSDIMESSSQISGTVFRNPPVPRSVASDASDFAASARGSVVAPRRSFSRRLGNLPALESEGQMEEYDAEEDGQSECEGSLTSGSVQPGPNNALVVRQPQNQALAVSGPRKVEPEEGSVDLQVFSKLLQEMREEGEQITKLKQQSKLLQGWYTEAKTWADEKSLRAWEATAIADDAEEMAALKHRQLKDLDSKLTGVKERLAGVSMLEQENKVLRQRIQAMTYTKGPNLLLEQLKHGPRIDLSGGFTQSLQQRSTDVEALNKWVSEMQEEGGQVERLKKINKLLQGWYADANSRAEDAIQREKEEFIRAKEAEELAAAGDLLVLEMEAKYSEMRMKLAMRQMLEQENRELHQKIVALSSGRGENKPLEKQQAILLEAISQNLGFSRGRPVVACLVYKAMVHWSMIEVERANTYDSVIEMIQSSLKENNWDLHCYWLSNAVHLHFLSTRGPSRLDATLAKSQMGNQIEKLYISIRENVKGQIAVILNSLLQPPPVSSEDSAAIIDASDAASVMTGLTAGTSGMQKLKPTPGNVRRQMTTFWASAIAVLRQFVDILRANFVPPLLVREFLTQILCYVDAKLFNSIMMHCPWVPCSLTNGETMEAGLSDLDDWILGVDEWIDSTLVATAISINNSLRDNLKHIRQSIVFMLDEHKPTRTLQQMQQMCPDLSMTQLAHICTWFEDDKDGMPGVDPSIIEQMWALMTEDSPFLIKEDKSCPFQADEVSRTLREFSLDDIEPPPELRNERAFYFLLPAQPAPPVIDSRRRLTM